MLSSLPWREPSEEPGTQLGASLPSPRFVFCCELGLYPEEGEEQENTGRCGGAPLGGGDESGSGPVPPGTCLQSQFDAKNPSCLNSRLVSITSS